MHHRQPFKRSQCARDILARLRVSNNYQERLVPPQTDALSQSFLADLINSVVVSIVNDLGASTVFSLKKRGHSFSDGREDLHLLDANLLDEPSKANHELLKALLV